MLFFLLLVLILFLVVIVLVPPMALVREVFRYFLHAHGLGGILTMTVALLAALVPFALNAVYLISIADDVIQGSFKPDRMLVVALFISWFAIWARKIIRRMRRRKRAYF